MGACIQCGHKSCFEAFHVTCARRARLCLRMKSSQSSNPLDASVLKAFCDRHSPSDWKRENDVEGATADAKAFYRHTMRHVRWGDSQAYALSMGTTQAVPSIEGTDDLDDLVPGTKRKRGVATRSWRLPSGAPVVPQAVYHNVENSLIKFNVRKRKEFVQEACKYWTLKREARRGAALLKRLQLQMEAFSSMEITRRNFAGMGAAGRPRLQRRIEFAEYLEDDMEQLRVLTQKVKEREEEKLKDVMVLKAIVDAIYFPIPPILEPILDRAQRYVKPSGPYVFYANNTHSYDGKGVFSEGFSSIQTKLDEKYYTSVQTFSEDMAAVFSSVIGFTTITNVGDAEHQLSGVAHNSLTAEQKEKKKLAKRIIKAIQPLFEDALRKESDLAGRPFERELPDLETLLDQRLGRRPSAAETLQRTMEVESVGTADAEGEPDDELLNGAMAEEVAKDKDAIQHAPTPDENAADHNDGARDDAADEAAIAAQLGQDAMHIATNGEKHDGDAMEVDQVGNGEEKRPAPLTPPRSENDLLAPLKEGGIPWYMEAFDPKGTTVHEERWSGREVLRDMSEELSELDDDELNGLADSEAAQPAGGDVSEDATLGHKARKQRRRYR